MIEIDKIYNMDCLEGMKNIPDKSVDLVVTDPPYEIPNVKAGGTSQFSKELTSALTQLSDANINKGFNIAILDELMRIMKTPNIYIWCNIKQIPMYIKYFVEERNCAFDILCWHKINAMPTFNNKYLSDKEYCLYFRRGGYCQPKSYDEAKTIFFEPINTKDKKVWGHPTIKPLRIIETLVRNSSREGDIVIDPFMGSGTTAIAAIREKRHFIGFELNKEYYDKSLERIECELSQPSLFD